MRVIKNVILRNPKTGAVTVVNAGDDVPEWAESMLGQHVKATESEDPKPQRKPRAKATVDDSVGTATDDNN